MTPVNSVERAAKIRGATDVAMRAWALYYWHDEEYDVECDDEELRPVLESCMRALDEANHLRLT